MVEFNGFQIVIHISTYLLVVIPSLRHWEFLKSLFLLYPVWQYPGLGKGKPPKKSQQIRNKMAAKPPHNSKITDRSNKWQWSWLQFNVLMANPGCSLSHKIHPNIVSNKVKPLMPTALSMDLHVWCRSIRFRSGVFWGQVKILNSASFCGVAQQLAV